MFVESMTWRSPAALGADSRQRKSPLGRSRHPLSHATPGANSPVHDLPLTDKIVGFVDTSDKIDPDRASKNAFRR